MCLAIPGRIVTMEKAWAEVDIMGILSTVNLQLIDKPELGEHVLIHAGCAIQKISTEHSMYLQSILAELIQGDETNGE